MPPDASIRPPCRPTSRHGHRAGNLQGAGFARHHRQRTLDGQLNPNSTFIFQMASTLTTSVNSTVTLINMANACNVFWQVGSSATLNTASVFNGNIMALASISLGTGATVNGRLLARTGAVTLLSNTVTMTGP